MYPIAGKDTLPMNRRTLLSGTAAAVAAAAAFPDAGPAQQSQISLRGSGRSTFILVHGSWYSSGIWERLTPLLVAAGHRVISRDRTAFGINARFPQSYIDRNTAELAQEPSPVAGVTLEQDVDLYKKQIQNAVQDGSGPVVLVGHSSAGIIITSIAEQIPELIGHLVYLSALMLAEGVTGAQDFASPENNFQKAFSAVFVGNPAQIGALRVDWNNPDPSYFAQLQHILFADGDPATFRALANLSAPDDPLEPYGVPTRKTAARWGSIRRSFIRTLEDVAILPALYDREIAQADAFTPANRTVVYDIAASHTSMVSQPGKLAAILLEIAGKGVAF